MGHFRVTLCVALHPCAAQEKSCPKPLKSFDMGAFHGDKDAGSKDDRDRIKMLKVRPVFLRGSVKNIAFLTDLFSPSCRSGAGRGCMRLLGDCGCTRTTGRLRVSCVACVCCSSSFGQAGRKAVLTLGMTPDRITFDCLLRRGENGISG